MRQFFACLLCVVLAVGVAAGATVDDPLSRGVAAYRAGAPAHALADFADAARANPRSALPALWAGVAAVAAGRAQDANTWFNQALSRPHSAAEARIARAWLDRLAVFAAPMRASTSAWLTIAGLAHASNPRLTDAQARWIGQAVAAASQREGIDPWLLASVVYIESRFNHTSVSWAGAMGLGQLMPATAAAAGVDPRDPWGNLLGAAEVLRWNYQTFGSWPLALAAYNAGSDAVRKYGGIPPYAETTWYCRAALQVWSELREMANGGRRNLRATAP
jgi:soluble lytic murein transglycosylase-like protein